MEQKASSNHLSAIFLLTLLLGATAAAAASAVDAKTSGLVGSPICNSTAAENCGGGGGGGGDAEGMTWMELHVAETHRFLADPGKTINYKILNRQNTFCNGKKYGDCIAPVGSNKRACSDYNRCKKYPDS